MARWRVFAVTRRFGLCTLGFQCGPFSDSPRMAGWIQPEAQTGYVLMQKILYLVSEDWYFVSHRLPMARAARNAGYEVHVATRVGICAAQIEGEGFHLHPIEWRRGSINPFRLVSAVMETRRL